MRIAYAANVRLPTERAHGLQIMEMCRAFAQEGHEVRLFVPKRRNFTAESPWERYGMAPSFAIVEVPIFDFVWFDRWFGRAAVWLNALQFAYAARKAVRAYAPDVVYARDPWFTGLDPRARYVYEAHDFPERVTWLHRRLWSAAARVVAVTEALRQAFVAEGVPEAKTVTAHDGVDAAKFAVRASKAEARAALGLPSDAFIAVYTGHLYPYKGADDLLEACAHLRPASRVVFVGGRPDDLARLAARASGLKAANAAFAGQVPHAEVARYLRAADAAVLPTRASDRHAAEFLSPLKLFEYLAAGKAIVATDTPSVREVLPETAAVFVPPSSPDALAAALNDLADLPARREALEREASVLAIEHSWNRRAARVLAGLPEPRPALAWFRRYRTELALALCALVLRAAYVLFMPQVKIVGGDGVIYLGLSDLVRGLVDGVPNAPTYYPVLYPHFLAAVRELFGDHVAWIRLWQAAFSAATVFLMSLAARRWMGREAVVPTGLLGALYVPMILESGIIYTETLYTLCLAAAVFGALVAVETRRHVHALAAGAAFALAGLTRELGFYQAALFAGFAGVLKRSWKLALLILLPTVVALWAVGLRNDAIARKLSLEAPPLVSKNYEASLAEPTLIRHLFWPDRWHLYPQGVFLYFRFPHRLSDLGTGEPIADPNPDGDVVLHLDAKRPFAPQPPTQAAAKILLTLFHWTLLALAAYGLWRGRLPRRVKAGLMFPIAFAFLTIMFYGIKRLQGFEGMEPLARYRFPSEPFILLLTVAGALALKTGRKALAPKRETMHPITPEVVRAVNLAYHEEEAAAYDSRHPEIFKDELGHWGAVAREFSELKKEKARPVRVVDLGTGTGFVPLRLAGTLEASDEMVLTDLSPAMLAKARETLEAAGFAPRTRYELGDAGTLDVPPGSVDAVTMNSVLHHLPTPDAVFAAIDRLLAPGGIVVIAHEPNARHFRHPVVGGFDRLIRALRSWKGGRRGPAAPNAFADRVNARLLAAGVVDRPLSVERIESIVDIHSPTAGRTVDPLRGFDPRALASASFPGYAVRRLETYRHLGKVDAGRRAWLSALQRAFERLWPDAGALFLLVLKKPEA